MLPGLKPGDVLPRREVHDRYGGSRQGGIAPSSRTNVVLFFTNPAIGHRHGYYDGWGGDGLFHYVGEGQQGDQQLVRKNKSIAEHHRTGRTLEGFRADGKLVQYLGEFKLIDHYFTDAHETNDPSVLRQVIVFRLQPRNEVPVELPNLPLRPKLKPRIDVVPVEEKFTERAFVTPDREPFELERRESVLVHHYRTYLENEGHTVRRLRIIPPGESRPLYSDLWDETTKELIEAKSSVTRDQLRLAVGQLFDYGRFVDARKRTILVPSRPREDLLNYLRSTSIGVTYLDDDGTWRHDDLS
ncbi:hypothetical protein [Saccharomonospora cyanea]|uniref:ScoMcrA-like SRA domain-containing protein n=1 Tax=Saccharomonospora cyanea NA-134 TaxID=882082 RepID=H5XN27_9PSEU|nr:hypothetical protein [Saccharomonospora cyanea]EHR63194.1 hypothetical protein SaccyDRAFT_4382 [Saccharomonospora cyanea NA-134]